MTTADPHGPGSGPDPSPGSSGGTPQGAEAPPHGGRRSQTPRATVLSNHAEAKLQALQHGLLDRRSTALGTAATLRRCVARPAGSEPAVWEQTLGGLPAELVGRTDAPSPAEAALHLGMCLYATHQQSKAEPMHVQGHGLGAAVRKLIATDDAGMESSPHIRRFNALATSDSLEELSWHLRSLVTQLRAAGIPLDYALLIRQLYVFTFSDGRDKLRLRWGRDLYAQPSKTDKGDSKSKSKAGASTSPTPPPES